MKTSANDYPLQLPGENIPMVRFQNVTKRYGDLVVLDSLDLDVEEGEMVTIIGPSGSGKTTVLRMLMALELINDGVIYVEGQPMTHMVKNGTLSRADKKYLRMQRLNIGMCFQHFNLFPHMTALENCIEAPIQVLGLSKQDAIDRAEDLLEMVGMLEKAKLVDKHNLTMLMVTHQMGFAREISDRVCFFYDGKIEEQGAPDQLFDNPRNERTRQFLSAVFEAN